MKLHIVLDVNIALDLLLKRPPAVKEKARIFSQFRKSGAFLFFAAAALPSLEYVHAREIARLIKAGELKTELSSRTFARKQLDTFLETIHILSSTGFSCKDIPADHPDREDALIGLSAGILPEPVYLWTNDRGFDPVAKGVTVIDHMSGTALLEKSGKASITFIDLATQQTSIRNSIEKCIFTVLRHGKYIMGPEIQELEEKLAEYVGVKHAITVASGTDSLEIALRALNIGPGDEVITVPFTWISTAEVICQVGARPVFIDIEPITYNMNVDLLEAAITPRTRAILPASLFGQMPDYSRINAIAAKYEIPVIEDAAQSFGATQHGKRSCGVTLIGSTSFFPAKPFGCYGDGGAIFTNDDQIADKMRANRTHGGLRRHHHPYIGMNGRLDTIQAAILLAKFPLFLSEVESRGRIGGRYSERLTDVCQIPIVADGNTHVYAQYTIRLQHRDTVGRKLQRQGVPTAVYYPKSLHEQPAFGLCNYQWGDFPESEKASREVISLPMHPFLTESQQDIIIALVKAAICGCNGKSGGFEPRI